MRRLLVGVAFLTVGCAGGSATSTTIPITTTVVDASSTTVATTAQTTPTTAPRVGETGERSVGGDRPARLVFPPGWEPGGAPQPLVVLLHGYGASGALQDLYLGVSATGADLGYLTLIPDGTVDLAGNRFWNVADVLVDDVSYLTGIIDEAVAGYGADPSRVYVVGHSNGGFMAHRLACEAPGKLAAIATLAGGIVGDGEACREPMRVIVIHGTDDPTVPYDGGSFLGVQLQGAAETAGRWRTADGCAPDGREEGRFDFDLAVPGEETAITVWDDCAAGTSVELWTMNGSGHIPAVFLEFRSALMTRLLGEVRSQ